MAEQPKCPKCGSVIYSRRIPVCGRCGEKLPESVLFDPATRKRVEKAIEQEKKRAAWETKFPGQSTSSADFTSL
jgi:hypothetical protein